jgi:hypothetical protein
VDKTPIELRNAKLGAKVVKALQSRAFEAWYFDEIAGATEKVFSLIPRDHVVSWGGSLTVTALNLTVLAAEKGYTVIDRDAAANTEERMDLMRKALLCDTFLTSANAISEDGQLVNIDGNGNRVAAMIFGPRQVIVVAGMNKVAKTLADALVRARTVASPLNVQRFPALTTPCNENGSCADCLSAASICNYFVTIRRCNPPGRIKVILVGKDLGL